MDPRALLLFVCVLPAALSNSRGVIGQFYCWPGHWENFFSNHAWDNFNIHLNRWINVSSAGVNDNFENDVNSLTRRLLQYIQPSAGNPNPSFHIALRLATPHNLQDEQTYLHKLKTHFKHKLNRRCTASSGPSTGLLALYLLALQSSCQVMSSETTAVACLKEKLAAEKKAVHVTGHPLTNYYQYSLGMIALCLNGIRIHHQIVITLANVNWGTNSPQGEIDSAAMAALALQCVQNASLPAGERLYGGHTLGNATQGVETLISFIQSKQKDDGTFKNIYSTSLGLQALCAGEPNDHCLRGRQKLVDEAKKGVFKNRMALAQLLPVLYRKTLLDIRRITCNDSDGLAVLETSEGGEAELGGEVHSVSLTVMDVDGHVCYGGVTLPLRAGMSLLDVLEEARKNDQSFTFETKETRWGPFLTSVNHMKEQKHDRIYWQLITGEKIPLIQGIRDYLPKAGERILLRLSKY